MARLRSSLPLIFGLSAVIGGLFAVGAYSFEFPCVGGFGDVAFSSRGEALIGAARLALQTPARLNEIFIPFFLTTLAVFTSPFVFAEGPADQRIL